MDDLRNRSGLWLVRLHLALIAPDRGPTGDAGGRARDDRGDVPGWVMITVMSAGIVAILTPLAGEELKGMLQSALNSVK